MGLNFIAGSAGEVASNLEFNRIMAPLLSDCIEIVASER
jgi:hypothetical protein